MNFDVKAIIIPKTKNGSPSRIPLTKMTIKTLSAVHQRVSHLNSHYVFCDTEGKQYSRQMVSVAFKRAAKRAGIDDFPMISGMTLLQTLSSKALISTRSKNSWDTRI